MLIFKGMRFDNVPKIPETVKPFIEQRICIDLTQDEITTIEEILCYFGRYVKTHPLPANIACMIVYLPHQSVDFRLLEGVPALTAHLVMIELSSIRQLRLTKCEEIPVLWPAILEELFHCLYWIRDEFEVKHYVVQVMQQRYPQATFEALYETSQDWLGNPVPALICELRE